MEKWDYCIQGQGHSEGSKFQRMFVRIIFLPVSDRVRSVSPEPLNQPPPLLFFFIKLGMVVYYHEAICHVEKLVHYLQSHSEGLYYQNITIFCYIF